MYKTTKRVKIQGGKISIGVGQIIKPSMLTKEDKARLLQDGGIVLIPKPRKRKPAKMAEE